jgi:hypothetical protein
MLVKRFLLLLFALFCLGSVARPAYAGHWVTDEIAWRITYQGGFGGTNVFEHDTLYAPYPIKTSLTNDTSGVFHLNNAAMWRKHDGAATTVDTSIVAYLMIQQDSTGATASAVSSLTAEFDGRMGGYRNGVTNGVVNPGGWTQFDSTAVTYVANGSTSSMYNATLTIPIRAIDGLGGWKMGSVEPQAGINFGYRLFAFDELRVRLSAAAGVLSGSLRCFVRYYVDEPGPYNRR